MNQFKMCIKCKSMIPLIGKSYCDLCSKERSKERRNYSDAQSIYNNGKWRKVKNSAMHRANGLCEVCLCYGKRTIAKEVHHIVTVIEGNDDTHYNLDNLIACCHSCHKKIEGMSKENLIKAIENGDLE